MPAEAHMAKIMTGCRMPLLVTVNAKRPLREIETKPNVFCATETKGEELALITRPANQDFEVHEIAP
jgi:hypothetical protein